jgi:hypothetical protein
MDNMLKQIRENWLLFAFVGGLIVWYSGVNARLTEAEQDIRDLKILVQEINEIQTSVAVIQANVEFIKSKLE